MMTSGVTAKLSDESNSTASSTAVSGSRSIPTTMAPMPIATAGTSGSPGRCDSATPPAAPMKIDGKIGPPRKLLSETLYPTALHIKSSSTAPSVKLA